MTKEWRFLERTNERTLPDDYRGDVLVWDIDKTYLDTRFSSLRGLLAIPFELAIDKRALPGAVPLLRALRHGGAADSALVPLYFISGSPKELRRVVERKMTLDGVQFDGICFKDQWGLVRARRPKAIIEQIGYKLAALLLYRSELPRGARFMLFGDDVERDLDSFLLFGEVCAGLRGAKLADRLRSLGAYEADIESLVTLADTVPLTADPVESVFIREVRGGRVSSTDPRVSIAPTYIEVAKALFAAGKIREEDLARVAAECVS